MIAKSIGVALRKFLCLSILALTGIIAGCSADREVSTAIAPQSIDQTDGVVVRGAIPKIAKGGTLVTVVAPRHAQFFIMTDDDGMRQTIKLHARHYAENLGAFVFTLNTESPLTPSIQREIVAQINIPNALRTMVDLIHYRHFITIDKNGHTVTLDLAVQNYDDNILSVVITLNDLNHHAEEFNFVIDHGRTVFVDIDGQTITVAMPIIITVTQAIDFVPLVVQDTVIITEAITNTIIISDPSDAPNPADLMGHTLTIRQTIALGDPIPNESLHLNLVSIEINATLTIIAGEGWDSAADFNLPAGKEFVFITVTIITEENIIMTVTSKVDIHYVTVAGDGLPSDLVVLSFVSETGQIWQITVARHRLLAETENAPTITIVLRGEDNTILGTLVLAATNTTTMTITTEEYYYDAALTVAEITVYDGYLWVVIAQTITSYNMATVVQAEMTVGVFADGGLPAFAILPAPNPSDGKNYQTAEFSRGTGLDNINADAAYQRGYFGQGVTVAVIDSGLLTTHLEFVGRVVPGYDFIRNTNGVIDNDGHGTHVAGIIGGAMDGERFHGVAPSVHIMPLRAIDSGGGTNDQVLGAMRFAVDNGAHVINNSWAGENYVRGRFSDQSGDYVIQIPILPQFMDGSFFTAYGQYFNGLVALMQDADVIQVYAAANDGWNTETGFVDIFIESFGQLHWVDKTTVEDIINNFIADGYGPLTDVDPNGVSHDGSVPLTYDSLIGKWLVVVATDDNDVIASFSNGCGAAKYWCLAAPGVNIWSAVPFGDVDIGLPPGELPANDNTAIGINNGTSMAAPHVSGALALLISRLPQMPKPVIKAILLATATDLGEDGVDEVYGHGLVNVGAAITVQGSVGLVIGECSRCRKPPEKNIYGIYENSINLPPPNPSDGKNYRTAEFNFGGGLDNINADAAYQRGYFGQGVTVAVIDTGLLTTHVEFAGRIVPGYDYVLNTPNMTDDVGHGTHVAGIIGGGMNGILFHGVAPSVHIMPLAILNSDLEDQVSINSKYDSQYEATGFAIQNGAKIINNSWGTSDLLTFDECIHVGFGGICSDPLFYEAYIPHQYNYDFAAAALTYKNRMGAADVIQVFAAGNNGWNVETGKVRFCQGTYDKRGIGRGDCIGNPDSLKLQDFIARYRIVAATLNRPQYFALLPLYQPSLVDRWLAVVATDDNDTIVSFSNGCGAAKYWCLAAPGVGIWSAVSYDEDGNYRSPNITAGIDAYSGTSMSAPHVSGALALLLSRFPHMPMPILKAILLATATDLGEEGVDDVYGHGLVNVAAAITVQGEIILVNDDDTNTRYNAVANAHKRMNLSHMMAHLHQPMAHLSVAFNFMDNYYFGASYQSFITPQADNILPLGDAATDMLSDDKTEIEMLDARKLPTFFAAADDEHFLYYGAETKQWHFRYDLCTDCGGHLWTPKTDSFAKPFFATQQAAAAFTWHGVNGWSPFIAIDTEGEHYQQFGLQWHKENAMAHWGAEISHIREQGKVLGSDFGDGYFAVVDDGRATQMRAFIRRDLWDNWSGFAEYQWGRGDDVAGEILLKQLSSLRFDGWQLGLAGKSAIMHGDRLRLSMTKPTAMRGMMQAHHCSSTKPVMVEDLQYHLDSDYECEIVEVAIDAPRTMIYALGYELPSRNNVRTAIGLEYRDRAKAHELAASFALRWAW